MKLNKNGRKIQRAIRRALMLGLPVAGLLATVGCERKAALGEKLVSPKEDAWRTTGVIAVDGPMGQVKWTPEEEPKEPPKFTERRGDAFSDVVEK